MEFRETPGQSSPLPLVTEETLAEPLGDLDEIEKRMVEQNPILFSWLRQKGSDCYVGGMVVASSLWREALRAGSYFPVVSQKTIDSFSQSPYFQEVVKTTQGRSIKDLVVDFFSGTAARRIRDIAEKFEFSSVPGARMRTENPELYRFLEGVAGIGELRGHKDSPDWELFAGGLAAYELLRSQAEEDKLKSLF